ncbi:ferritin-like protein [Streptomyces gamaensis]|uniref:Ferritin-like protein n=1 Tax=Streptomyces gamaensis TaxID=1763542 RepID=A0ABW0Z076_9ACTN
MLRKPPPSEPPPITDIETLRDKLQDAIQLEFTTIPAYLSGWYSVKNRRDDKFQDFAEAIQWIVVTEMRHMSIACNILIAFGGTPEIAKRAPVYPCAIPDMDQSGLVHLMGYGSDFVKLGLFIEKPASPPPCLKVRGGVDRNRLPGGIPRLVDPYPSIGAFYSALITALDGGIPNIEQYLDPQSLPRQYIRFGGQDYIGVDSVKQAVALMHDIIDEGEGSDNQDGHYDLFDENGDLSHFYSFAALKNEQGYTPGDDPCKPSGPALTRLPKPGDVVNIPSDPMMCKYTDYPDAWKAADAFNQFYARIVDDLDTGFKSHPHQIDSAIGRMHQLEALADKVLAQKLAGDTFAAPTFELKPYRTEPPQLPKR